MWEVVSCTWNTSWKQSRDASPHENVCIPAFIKNTPKSEAEKRAKELLSFLGLSHRENHKPNELSGGEQQRVAVARALMNNPSIILADEPSGNLDTESAENLHRLFFKLRDEFGQTFIIVTHNEELAEMADRKLEMQDGNIRKGWHNKSLRSFWMKNTYNTIRQNL